MQTTLYLLLLFLGVQCTAPSKQEQAVDTASKDTICWDHNVLDYGLVPKDSLDKSGLMFSDQGAWFAFSHSSQDTAIAGFSGPFLMTQDNGVWLSPSLIHLGLSTKDDAKIVDWNKDFVASNSYASHLEQSFANDSLNVQQQLVYLSAHTALVQYKVQNTSDKGMTIYSHVNSELYDIGVKAEALGEEVLLSSDRSSAIGHILFQTPIESMMDAEVYYNTNFRTIYLEAGQTYTVNLSLSFIFPEYSWDQEKERIATANFEEVLATRKQEKVAQINTLLEKDTLSDSYKQLLAKSVLTLQNNWRVAAGEIDYQGLFPSYHYVWFNGFWSWDSWKHSVGLSHYDLALAKDQMRLMFAFQKEDGFIVDVVYRDTSIERHNFRDTKPPLSAWAVAKIYEKDQDIAFVQEMYPKLMKYHQWWYNKRDHDGDGLCEYGSTDGSLIAAKWESGMDNAIRFDDAKIVKNGEGAYSMNQESVDLNAYLYAEKGFLSQLAKALGKTKDATQLEADAASLKNKIQTQFYDPQDGWFYDTNLKGNKFIKGEGSEGWTTLWAKAATAEQASAVKERMMNPAKFFTAMPFQTMSADHPKFDPLNGYWRGPNWLDQSYFGVQALRNYGFDTEADAARTKIFATAEGLLEKGKAIRENYHPLTGKGLHAHNFSWSAAHIIMFLLGE